MYTPKQDDTQEDVETPMLLLIPVGLVEWMLTTPRTAWEIHKKIMAIVTESGAANTPPSVDMCLGWCLKAGMVKMGSAGCNIFPPEAVPTTDPVTIRWLKQQLETTMGTETAPVQQI